MDEMDDGDSESLKLYHETDHLGTKYGHVFNDNED